MKISKKRGNPNWQAPPGGRRDLKIASIAVNAQEKQLIKERAAAAGMTVAAYVRACALGEHTS